VVGDELLVGEGVPLVVGGASTVPATALLSPLLVLVR
jgi:hypothetical protein